LKHEAKLYWVETEDSRKRLSKFLNINIDNIVVATNNANENFEHKKNYELSDSKLPSDNFKLLFISGYYVHKNHKFIVEVDSKLKEKNYTVDFIVTLEDKDFKQINPSGIKNIINVGQLLPHQCPLYYRLSDAVFMPSLIETFTAVYPEAMISERPIITSNLSFAKNLCGPAALFYNYDSASSAADCIIQLINDKNLYNSLVEQGKSQVKLFDTPKERFKKVLNHLIKG
jgi:glycosyltransferase involved in cell wall biosynthesis